jgi:hypothetical protein
MLATSASDSRSCPAAPRTHHELDRLRERPSHGDGEQLWNGCTGDATALRSASGRRRCARGPTAPPEGSDDGIARTPHRRRRPAAPTFGGDACGSRRNPSQQSSSPPSELNPQNEETNGDEADLSFRRWPRSRWRWCPPRTLKSRRSRPTLRSAKGRHSERSRR